MNDNSHTFDLGSGATLERNAWGNAALMVKGKVQIVATVRSLKAALEELFGAVVVLPSEFLPYIEPDPDGRYIRVDDDALREREGVTEGQMREKSQSDWAYETLCWGATEVSWFRRRRDDDRVLAVEQDEVAVARLRQAMTAAAGDLEGLDEETISILAKGLRARGVRA